MRQSVDASALAFGRLGRTGGRFGGSGKLSDVEVYREFISCLILSQSLRNLDIYGSRGRLQEARNCDEPPESALFASAMLHLLAERTR